MTQYNPQQRETFWQNFWLDQNVYQWDPSASREDTFVIDTPPPTVSGTLHMGHLFSYTQTDFIARHRRMCGKTVFYPFGADNNGLPTERLVEKMRNVRAVDMPREDFIKLCKEVIPGEEAKFRALFASIGLSMDFDQSYQTISPSCMAISQMSFLDLLQKDRVYRALSPCFWDPVDLTALAQADLVDREMPGVMNYIIFETDSNEPITIATTRPELIQAVVAVFYHPADKRYQHLAGCHAITPIFGDQVPIIADETVSMEKGTGLVMCATFGDSTDIQWWKRHKLPLKIIINEQGKIEGLNVKQARAKILESLKQKNLLVKQEDLVHNVKCAERSGVPVEILVTPQWFVRLLDQTEQFKAKTNECHWYPESMKNRMEQWIDGLKYDWCISRQRFFGVPFPIWYSKRAGEEGKILIPELQDLPVDPAVVLPRGYTRDEVEADTDVMDTWATSSVTPQINSRGINEALTIDSVRHRKLFPADLRPQAHEIIRTWAFYTIAKAHFHQNSIPWKNLMISGWCLAADREKMAKSKGNIVSPVGLVESYGADVVRYWASTAKLGTDIVYSEKTMALGKKLVTKLWNACKFAAPHLDAVKSKPSPLIDLVNNLVVYETMDVWLATKLTKTIERVNAELEVFEYHNARITMEDFFWHDFCDNYLEIVKNRIYDTDNKNPTGKMSAVLTLYHALLTIIKMFAIYLPHLSEELYQTYFRDLEGLVSVHSRGSWPVFGKFSDVVNASYSERCGDMTVQILDAVRKIKADKKMSMKVPSAKLVIKRLSADPPALLSILADLQNVCNCGSIELGEPGADGVTTNDGNYEVALEF